MTESNHPYGREAARMVRVTTAQFRKLMLIADVSNRQLAAATGVSPTYVSQVRNGARKRVSRKFIGLAGDYLGLCLGEPGRVTAALIEDPTEDESGR